MQGFKKKCLKKLSWISLQDLTVSFDVYIFASRAIWIFFFAKIKKKLNGSNDPEQHKIGCFKS
jgi:hypothetical protein